MRRLSWSASFPAGIALLVFSLLAPAVRAQSFDAGQRPQPLITQGINENQRVVLSGNTRPEATMENDRGRVPDEFRMEHMLLQLKRPPEAEKAVEQFIEELQTPGSPNFHQWISAQEFGARFGVASQDLNAITAWLEGHGFQVNVVYASGMVIDFSGTAAQVRRAFQTDIHNLEVNGERHIANTSDPRIPAALAPVVAGVVSLHDFQPHVMYKLRQTKSNYTFPNGAGGNAYTLVPADLATIYNLNPLFSAGISGQGQTVVVLEDTNVYSVNDWRAFRSTLGLSGYTQGTFTTIHPAPPSGTNNCSNPGILAGNDAEAILDAEWASASAPSAAIVMASCADTGTTFGGLIAIQNMINGSSQPPAIMSISYGQCETVNGAAGNAAYYSAYQQAAAEGVSVFVSAGDSGAAGCDNGASEATRGIGVSAFASTPYNVAVGGTDFSDSYSGTNATYWNQANTATYGSAISYVPEMAWDDSCANSVVASFEGFSFSYGPTGFCNNSTIGEELKTVASGGGGPSGCATGAPAAGNAGVVSGTCQGWAKPSWQAVLGNPRDGVRDMPDVSLFAADGLWSHYYIFCWSDTAIGGSPCVGAPDGWTGAGGTSFASPIMAGIQALVNQQAGGAQGNPNPAYYQLAAAEYGASGNSACNASKGNQVASSCTFYDISLGDIDVDCIGSAFCFLDGASVGVLSTSDTSFGSAYPATTGWDFATGIGSVNAANLVNNWPTSGPNFSLSAAPGSLAVTQGTSGSTTVSMTPKNGFNGSVNYSAAQLPTGVTASFSPNPATGATTMTLTAVATAPVGTTSVTIIGTSGSIAHTASVALTVNPTGNFALSASPASLSILQGTSGASTITVGAQGGFNSNVTLTASGLPSGVTASFGTNPATSASTLTFTATITAAVGPATVTVTGTCGNLTNTTSIALTVNGAPNFSLAASPNGLTIPQGSAAATAISVTDLYGFSGSVSLSASGLPSGVTAVFSPSSSTTGSTLTLTASSVASTGTATVTITGTSGNLTNKAALSVTVQFVATLPSVWTDIDIGATGMGGASSYGNNVFTVAGAGSQIYATADAFHFVYQTMTGDGTLVARLTSFQGGVGYASAGVMIRNALDAGSSNVKTADWPNYNGIYFDARATESGGTTEPGNVVVTLPYWIKVTRSGSTFSSYVALDGVNWVQVGSSQTITMGATVDVGLAVTSGTTGSTAVATFDNVSVNSTAAPGPSITAVSATTGTAGSQVVITGTNYGATQGSSAVLLNDAPLTVSLWGATSITATIPSTAASGALVVSVAPSMNDSNAMQFDVTAQPLPASWLDQDLGAVSVLGSATSLNGTFTVNGAGQEIYGTADAFHFVYQPMTGDGTVVARVVSVQGATGYGAAGVMIRNTLDAGSANAKTADWPAYHGVYFDVRAAEGASTTEPGGMNASLPYWVKLTRSGNTFSSFASPDGANWTQVGSTQTITMGSNVYVGLAVASGSPTALATATFDNVSISAPAPPAPNFALSASPASLTFTQGNSGSSTITVTPQNGFSGSVNLSASGLPNGVTASFGTNPATTTSTLTLAANSSAATGTSSVTITGTSGSLTNTTTVLLTVNIGVVPSFSLSASPNSLTVVQGASGTSTVTIAPQNGFSGSVNLSASGLPRGVTATFGTNPATTTSVLTLAASGTATTGTATVTITGTSSSLTSTTTVALTVTAAGPPSTLPSPWVDSDIGATGVTGSASYANGVFTVKGAGAQIYGASDAFHFAYQPLAGDGTIVARLVSVQGTSSYGAAGVMIRNTLDPASANAKTADWPAYNGVYFDLRSTAGGSTSEPGSAAATQPYWVKISRSGVVFSSYVSPDGVNWTQIATAQTVTMAQTVYVGLAVTSGSTSTLATATFDNVSVTATSQPLPSPWLDQDIGTVGAGGYASYNSGTFEVNGAGAEIYGTADAFHFVYQPLATNGTIVARLVNLQGGSGYVAAGVMIRNALDAGSANAKTADWHSYNGIYFDIRTIDSGSTSEPGNLSVGLPYWIKVSRSGNVFTSYTSPDGVNWTQLGASQTISMGTNVYIGLAVTSGSTSALATATFDNVSITNP